MPTFKTVIHPRYKKADGVFRVKIRITHNKQSRYIPTCYYASSSEVNEKFDFKRGTSEIRCLLSTNTGKSAISAQTKSRR